MGSDKKYKLLNGVCLLAAYFCFFKNSLESIVMPQNTAFCFVLLGTALAVYGLKALRFYIVLAGSGISVSKHARQYCKTTLVNILLPLKAGEFFRAYCYGHTIHNYARAIMAVLLDRFSDTLALLTILFLLMLLQGTGADIMIYLLLVFMLLLILIYRMFPNFYKYWNQYLLREPATQSRLYYLAGLSYLHKIYNECRALVHGRIFSLYIISLMAWSIEIGGVVLAARITNHPVNGSFASAYLKSALGIHDFLYQKWFLVFSCVLLAIGMLILYGRHMFKKEERV